MRRPHWKQCISNSSVSLFRLHEQRPQRSVFRPLNVATLLLHGSALHADPTPFWLCAAWPVAIPYALMRCESSTLLSTTNKHRYKTPCRKGTLLSLSGSRKAECILRPLVQDYIPLTQRYRHTPSAAAIAINKPSSRRLSHASHVMLQG